MVCANHFMFPTFPSHWTKQEVSCLFFLVSRNISRCKSIRINAFPDWINAWGYALFLLFQYFCVSVDLKLSQIKQQQKWRRKMASVSSRTRNLKKKLTKNFLVLSETSCMNKLLGFFFVCPAFLPSPIKILRKPLIWKGKQSCLNYSLCVPQVATLFHCGREGGCC